MERRGLVLTPGQTPAATHCLLSSPLAVIPPPFFPPHTHPSHPQSTSLATRAHLHDSQSPCVLEFGQTGSSHLESWGQDLWLPKR